MKKFRAIIVASVFTMSMATVANAFECYSYENSQTAYEEQYGYYCGGSGPGCTICVGEVVVQG